MKDQPLTGGDVVKVVTFILLFLPPTLLGVGVVPTIFLLGGYYLMRKNEKFEYFASGMLATRIYLTLGSALGGLLFVFSAYPYIWGVGAELDRAYVSSSELEDRREKEYQEEVSSPGYLARLSLSSRVPEVEIPDWYIRQREIIDLQIVGLTATMESSWAGKIGLDRQVDSDWSDTWGSEDRDLVLMSLYWVGACALYVLLFHILLAVPMRSHRDWVAAHGIFAGKAASKKVANDSTKTISVVKGGRLKNYSVADELLKWATLKEAGHITEEEFQAARARLIERS